MTNLPASWDTLTLPAVVSAPGSAMTRRDAVTRPANMVPGRVSLVVTDEFGDWTAHEPRIAVDDVKTYLDDMTQAWVVEPAYCGYVAMRFVIEMPETGEIDGFMRIYNERRLVETV